MEVRVSTVKHLVVNQVPDIAKSECNDGSVQGRCGPPAAVDYSRYLAVY
jgi:hypothetical protein